jgi:hypothetical protein
VLNLPHQAEVAPRRYVRANSDSNEPNYVERQGRSPFDLAIDPVKHQKERKSILKKGQGSSKESNETQAVQFRGLGGYDKNKNSVPLPLKTIDDDEPLEDSDFGGDGIFTG